MLPEGLERPKGSPPPPTVDLLRFDLLKELRVAVPADVVDEWALWESLSALTTYNEESNFRYEHPKPS
jgi:hypothetical protein